MVVEDRADVDSAATDANSLSGGGTPGSVQGWVRFPLLMKSQPFAGTDSTELEGGHRTFFLTVGLAAGVVATVCALVATASSFWAADVEDELKVVRAREQRLIRRNAELSAQLESTRQQLVAVKETEREIRAGLVEQLARAKDQLETQRSALPGEVQVSASGRSF